MVVCMNVFVNVSVNMSVQNPVTVFARVTDLIDEH